MADTNTTTNTNIESSAVGSTENKETTNTNVGTETKETKTNDKTINLTQEELDKIITKRLERERQKAESEKQEAEKLAKLSEAERQKVIFDKERANFDKERQKFQNERMELEITKQLASEKLPIEFSKYLMADNAETAMNNINEFKALWTTALETEINKRLKGTTPKSGASNSGLSLSDFKGMSIEDINKNWSKLI